MVNILTRAIMMSTPLLLGALAYLIVYLGWWAVIRGERWRRLRRRARRPQAAGPRR